MKTRCRSHYRFAPPLMLFVAGGLVLFYLAKLVREMLVLYHDAHGVLVVWAFLLLACSTPLVVWLLQAIAAGRTDPLTPDDEDPFPNGAAA